MEAKAFATMKKENNIPDVSVLIYKEANKYMDAQYPHQKKIKSGTKNTVSRSFHMPPKKTLAALFILFVLFLCLVFLLWKRNELYPFGNDVTIIVDPIKGDNTKVVPQNLTLTILEEAKTSEPFSEAMQKCFDTAIREFMLEPLIVRENAKMILECNGTRREFVSGTGENYLEVSWVHSQIHYMVREANSQVYMARLGRHPLPLSLGSILEVCQRLVTLEESEELRQCLNKAIEEFPKEPQVLQDNAVLEVSCGGRHVTFRSEALQNETNEINVYKDMQGEVVFQVKARGAAWWARKFQV
ncbi:uncharacterized protein [Erythrolamprus reginae]|uniref:uncharacterized protein n=1 Tax=Erythrolamprus reginae TaxID=121349 RepID=UPI00396CADAD